MKENSNKKRVAIYIDGSNLYFSIKRTFNCKIDIEKFCKKLIGDNILVKINYYIAPVEQFSNPKMYAEQQSFFEKIKNIEKLKIIFGRLEKRKRAGEVYYVEKANDGDFSGAVSAVKSFGRNAVYVAIGNRKSVSHHIKKVASRTLYITKNFTENCKL